MTGTAEGHDKAQAALWSIPSYADLPTGRELGQVIEALRRARAERTCTQASSSEGLDSYRVYGLIGRQLEDLLATPEADELGRIRPSIFAVSQAKDRLFQMASSLVLPEPEDVSTDRDGAIRLSWRSKERFLELIFPYETTVRPYIYYSEGALFDISEDVSSGRLHGWVRWIEGAARPK